MVSLTWIFPSKPVAINIPEWLRADARGPGQAEDVAPFSLSVVLLVGNEHIWLCSRVLTANVRDFGQRPGRVVFDVHEKRQRPHRLLGGSRRGEPGAFAVPCVVRGGEPPIATRAS
jgi:hypothetical protein